jgi:hypothetical protein
MPGRCMPLASCGKKRRVDWIDVIAIITYLRNVIVTLNFGKLPLQFYVCLIDAIMLT